MIRRFTNVKTEKEMKKFKLNKWLFSRLPVVLHPAQCRGQSTVTLKRVSADCPLLELVTDTYSEYKSARRVII